PLFLGARDDVRLQRARERKGTLVDRGGAGAGRIGPLEIHGRLLRPRGPPPSRLERARPALAGDAVALPRVRRRVGGALAGLPLERDARLGFVRVPGEGAAEGLARSQP